MFTTWNDFTWRQTWNQPHLLKITSQAGIAGPGSHQLKPPQDRGGTLEALSWLWIRTLEFYAGHPGASQRLCRSSQAEDPHQTASSHIYPGIPKFSISIREIKICLDQWFSARGNFAPPGTCDNDSHLALACLSCRLLCHTELPGVPKGIWHVFVFAYGILAMEICLLPQLLCFLA